MHCVCTEGRVFLCNQCNDTTFIGVHFTHGMLLSCPQAKRATPFACPPTKMGPRHLWLSFIAHQFLLPGASLLAFNVHLLSVVKFYVLLLQ